MARVSPWVSGVQPGPLPMASRYPWVWDTRVRRFSAGTVGQGGYSIDEGREGGTTCIYSLVTFEWNPSEWHPSPMTTRRHLR